MGSTMEEYDLRKTFQLENTLLFIVGCYPRKNHEYIYKFGITLNLTLNFLQWISMIVQMIISRNDLFLLSETVQYFATCSTFTCKLINFHLNRRKLRKIEHFLTSPIFHYFPEDRLKILKNEIASCQTVSHVFRLLCALAVFSYSLIPLLDQNKSNTLPYPSWYPFNYTNCYWATYIFQMVGIVNVAYTNSTLDTLTWVFITIASAQFKILKENLKNIDYGSENQRAVKEEFKNCVRHHTAIVRFVYKIENMISAGIFLQFFSSVCVFCFIGFLMIIVPFPSMQFGFLVMYFSCMLCQIAMYCWYGHEVIVTNNTIAESFYMSNWYESGVRVRKDVIIFMERIKKPVKVTAGKFVTLSLTTFTTILRSSYSYIAVLNHVYKKL